MKLKRVLGVGASAEGDTEMVVTWKMEKKKL
jgi:hypothetical protein